MEKNKPDFNEWLKTKAGLDCLQWPISEPQYLQNRLFWAFDAGRDCIWEQYLKEKSQNERLLSALKEIHTLLAQVQVLGELGEKLFNITSPIINSLEKQP